MLAMHCVVDKVYHLADLCAECNMKLVPVNEKGGVGYNCHCC